MPRPSVQAFIGVGANLGDAVTTVGNSFKALGALAQTQLVQCSPLYRSAPIDSSGPDYVNAVVQLQTKLSAPELLQHLLALEAAQGRERPWRNAPRTLDLDLLLYGQAQIDSAQLTVPHPRMQQRAFVLRPLADIAPHLVDAAQLAAVADQRLQRIVSGQQANQGDSGAVQ